MSCAHEDFEADVDVTRLLDSGRYTADVRIRCKRCGVQMRFLGLPRGLDLEGASISFDGCEARLSIAPKGEDIPEFKGVTGFTIKPK